MFLRDQVATVIIFLHAFQITQSAVVRFYICDLIFSIHSPHF